MLAVVEVVADTLFVLAVVEVVADTLFVLAVVEVVADTLAVLSVLDVELDDVVGCFSLSSLFGVWGTTLVFVVRLFLVFGFSESLVASEIYLSRDMTKPTK